MKCLSSIAGALALGALTTAGVAGAQIPPDLELVTVTDIGSGRAVGVRHAGDGSNRLFIVQQEGLIWIYDLDSETLLPTPFLDIQTLVDDFGNEQGLLGLAFHPDYASNGYFYVNYTRDPGPGDDLTVVARYEVSAGNADVADSGSASKVIEIEQHSSNHNGGDIHFGPDGYLYIGMGDGGGAEDTGNYSQTRSELLGKMLRLDVDGGGLAPGATACGLIGNYTIPADNPFLAETGTCDEIWHIGLRNPWRFSFDRLTGDMFIGDVGQYQWEEVNVQSASSSGGENWGWRCYEGLHAFNTSGCASQGSYDSPILEYNHTLGCSITGGFRYRGLIAGLYGHYVYGDYCSGRIWFADDTGGWSSFLWDDTSISIATFGEDESGELYIGAGNGAVYRFHSQSSLEIFTDGFEAGNTTSWSAAFP